MKVLIALLLLLVGMPIGAAETAKEESAVVQVYKVTIAVGEMKKMVNFYGKVFGIELKEQKLDEKTSMFFGKLGTMALQFCPKELAGIKATENTIQLAVEVKDIDATLKMALENGGQKIGEVQTDGKTFKSGGVRDPDGNSIELAQKLKQ